MCKPGFMRIIKRSPIDGKRRKMDLPITQEMLDRWQNGELIQDCMPHLTPDEREFIKTGITPEQWDGIFPPEEEDGD